MMDEEIRLEYPLESLEEYRGASLDKLFMGTVREKRFPSLKRFSDGHSRM